MMKYLIAILTLTASFAANATNCNPTCTQPTNNLKPDEKVVDLRLTDATSDTVVTKLRIQAANGTKSVYDDQPVPLGLYQIEVRDTVVDAFCVDPFQPASSTNTKYIESKLDWSDFSSYGAKKMWLAQTLYDNAYGTLASATDAVKAGFHVALWEIFYDDLEETSGNIKASTTTTTVYTQGTKICTVKTWWGCKKWSTTPGTSTTTTVTNTDAAVLTAANAFLTALTDNSWKITNKYDLTFYKSVCNQDFIVAKLNPPKMVPLPAALPLMLTAIAGFGWMRRRKTA
jgi:hypothetical protein